MPLIAMPKWCALLGLAVFLVACQKPAAPVDPVRSIKVVAVESADSSVAFKLPGDVRARVESRLGFRVSGKIVQRSVELGQRVKPGQELARLDDRDFALAVQNAQAQMEAARTQRDLAQADLKRFEDLRKQQFISEAELDRRASALRAAQAQLDQATAMHRLQSNQRSDVRLMADASGVVTAVEAEAGQVVSAGQPIVRVALDGPRDIAVAVPEIRLKEVKLGQSFKVIFHATNESSMAKVREISAAAEPMTRTFEVRLSLDSGFQAPLGTTATVEMGTSETSASAVVAVPMTALLQKNGKSTVWVFDETSMTVRAQAVQVAQMTGDRAIISQGLQVGQLIVAAGPHVLTDGQRVTRFSGTKP